MKVARSVTVSDVVVEEAPDPVAGPGEVVCRVLACGVCGSDVSPSWVARKVPAVLGHEVVGRVVEVGEGVSSSWLGRDVVVHHHAACGSCARCRSGHDTMCAQFRATSLDPGGFAELVRVSAPLVGELLPLDGLDVERATFVEPLGCVLRALRTPKLASSPSPSVVVVGAGTGGLLAVAALLAEGRASRVFVREPRPERLALARRLGAVEHDGTPCDLVLLCTGAQAAVDDAVAACAIGAELLLYATPSGRLDLDGDTVYGRDVTVTTSYSAGPGDMRAAHGLLASGAVDPLPLVTHRVPLASTADALRLQRTGEAIKALVVP